MAISTIELWVSQNNIVLLVAAGFKQKNDPPLGGALCAIDTLFLTQGCHIAGHLTLEKFAAVGAAEFNIASGAVVALFGHCQSVDFSR